MPSEKLNLLNEDLDEASQKYIQENLENWKEQVTNQLVEQMEQVKASKLEELEEENQAYREQLKEEYTDKMLDGINELKESIKADVTASVIKNNPEIKILEQIKEIVAPLISEDYRSNTYEDTLSKLVEENANLKHEKELTEGARTLATLLAPYSEKTQKLVASLVKEGSPEYVTEQFYNIFESLSDNFEEEKKDVEDENEDDENDGSEDEDEDDENEDDEENGKEDKDLKEESYIEEGYDGNEGIINEDDESKKYKTTLGTIKSFIE